MQMTPSPSSRASRSPVTPLTRLARQLARSGGSAIAQTLASTVPYGPQAYRAASIIARTWKGYKARKKAATDRKIRLAGRKWNTTSTGSYAGKFKKARYSKKPKVETLCLKKGYHLTNETYGRIDDPDCVYILHNTSPAALLARAITGHLYRKLFKRAGINIDSKDAELPLFSTLNSDGFKIEYVVMSPFDSTVAATSYITVNDDSLKKCITNGPMLAGILNYIQRTTDNEPHQLNLYSSDRNALDTNWRLASSLNLQNEIITLYSSSALTVQNRTAAQTAGAGDLSSDRVDNQPLMGYMYHFKNSDPRLKFTNETGGGIAAVNLFLGYVNTVGLNLVRAGEMQGDLSEPPVPKYFANCDKSSKIRLEPGTMKKSYISHKFHGRMTNVLKKIRCTAYNAGLGKWVGVQGRAQMIALEETLRTDSANKITVQYEVEFKVGCIGKTQKLAAFSTDLTAANINNIG